MCSWLSIPLPLSLLTTSHIHPHPHPQPQPLQGSCGFGLLQKNLYPYWTAAAFSPANKFYQASL